MSSYFQQGWEEQSHDKDSHNIQIASKFVAKDKPLGILQSTKHSLQPDMLFGWRPKLASCPLPLKFPNPQTSKLMQLVVKSDLYRMAYRNKHFVSSVQVNQRYDYYWKYRSRYSLNLALIQQAAKEQQQIAKQHSGEEQINLPHYLPPCEYTFSADFQSGNLDYAIRIKPNQYDCFLRSDSNTRGHCNWYYFSVKNNNRVGEVKVNVCNIGKINNLYNKGMKPYVRESDANLQMNDSEEWSQQPCYNVEFVERVCRYGSESKRFELQFRYNFIKPNMEVFFAYGIPYTYSKLQKFIKEISSNQQYQSYLVVDKLCQSLGGLNLPLLRITSNAAKDQQIETHKKAVILSARIHPGESHSSIVIEGLIRELLANNEQAKILREYFVFYIIPMINIDGVIVGNYRTSLSGKDLNRQFMDLDPFIYPEITKLHELALEIRQKHFQGIEFYMDFHGHSSKKNLFAYGPEHSTKSIYYFKSRIFPKLIQSIHPIFSYKKSNFKISEGKKKTARAHMLWKLKIPMVYTFEVSNGMYETANKEDVLLTQKILLEAGQAVLKGFYKYVRLEMKIPSKLLSKKVNFIQNNKENIKKRVIKSSKGIRDSSIGLTKRRVSKMNELSSQNYLSEKFLFDKGKRINSTKKDLTQLQEAERVSQIDEQQQLDEQALQNLEEFMGLIDSVRNTKHQLDIQGGSDSESEGEDMQKQEVQKLFSNIKNRKRIRELKQKKKPSHRYSRQQKSKKQKSPTNINDQNSPTNIFTEIKKELKKFKNNQLQELIKETKKLNTQMSYATLSSNRVNHQPLLKSPSVGERLTRVSGKLYNVVVSTNLHVEREKVMKVALLQRKFDLEI